MQFQDIYKAAKQAFETGEVRELLEGKGNYNYQAPMYPVSLPTCIEFVLREGIYPLYRDTKNPQVVELYCDALKQMIESDNAVTVWWATSILYLQKINECADWVKTPAPFKIADCFWDVLGRKLPRYKLSLMKEFCYQGNGEEHGLWSDVLRINHLLYNKYSVRMLEEI